MSLRETSILRRIARHTRLDLGELRYQLDREGIETAQLPGDLLQLEKAGLVETRLEIWLTPAGKAALDGA